MSPGFPESHGAFSFYILPPAEWESCGHQAEKHTETVFLTPTPCIFEKNKKIVTFLNIFLDGVKKCAKLK